MLMVGTTMGSIASCMWILDGQGGLHHGKICVHIEKLFSISRFHISDICVLLTFS